MHQKHYSLWHSARCRLEWALQLAVAVGCAAIVISSLRAPGYRGYLAAAVVAAIEFSVLIALARTWGVWAVLEVSEDTLSQRWGSRRRLISLSEPVCVSFTNGLRTRPHLRSRRRDWVELRQGSTMIRFSPPQLQPRGCTAQLPKCLHDIWVCYGLCNSWELHA